MEEFVHREWDLLGLTMQLEFSIIDLFVASTWRNATACSVGVCPTTGLAHMLS
jgi:hypothetical protein